MEQGTRRAAEDALAKELTKRGAEGVPAYTLLAIEESKEQARRKLGALYAPPRIETTLVVLLETLVYDLEGDRLLWGGTSDTFHPSKTVAVVVEVARAAAERMKTDGLLR